MYFHMLLHVCLLVEHTIASGEVAGEWFLICVDSQMVEKVVPESKDFVAVLMGAVEQPDYRSVWLEASELKDIVRACLRSILRVNRAKIKVLSSQHHNRIILIKNIYCWVAFFVLRKIPNEIKSVFF